MYNKDEYILSLYHGGFTANEIHEIGVPNSVSPERINNIISTMIGGSHVSTFRQEFYESVYQLYRFRVEELGESRQEAVEFISNHQPIIHPSLSSISRIISRFNRCSSY